MNEQTTGGQLSPSARWTPRENRALAGGLVLAVLWSRIFGLERLAAYRGNPALGALVFTAAVWGAALLMLGKSARWNRWNAGLAVGVGLLAVCCAVYGDMWVRSINCLLILCGSALAFFSLSGSALHPLADSRVVPETVGLTFRALFSAWGVPFGALKDARGSESRRTARSVLWGLLAAVPLLALVLWLLAGADSVFDALLGGFSGWLRRMDAGLTAWRALRIFLFTLAFFSALRFLCLPPREKAPEKARDAAPAAPFVTVLALLCAVYLVFDAIQVVYLFGGAQAAAMGGGYAEYARSGFFQLVAVAAVNLTVLLVCLSRGERTAPLRVLSALLLALTAVILVSAFLRMTLYISAYGLSLLRAVTLWAMGLIAVSLALGAVKLRRPDFRFWPVFAAVGLAGWVVLNLVNIDARIADYNVDAYLSGRLEQADTDYLAGLSPDVIPALARLRDNLPEDAAISPETVDAAISRTRAAGATTGWQDWYLNNARGAP